MTPYRAVFFDVGGTILEQRPSAPEVIAGLLHERGVHVEVGTIGEELSHVTDQAGREATGLAMCRRATGRVRPARQAVDPSATWAAIYNSAIARAGVLLREELGSCAVRELARAEQRLLPDVLPALTRLHSAGVIIGLISNFDSGLSTILEAFEVAPYFTVQVVSGEEGIAKPDVAVFELALKRAGVPAQASAYVGDELWFDIKPAAEVGITPVLLDRTGHYHAYNGLRITSLEQLADVLGL